MPDDLNEQLKEFGMQLEFWPVADLLALSKKTRNPMKHFNNDIEKLAKAFDEVGFKNVVYINKDATEIPAGNGRIMAAARSGKYEKLPVFRILDLTKAKLKKFALGDNKLRSEKWDEQILVETLADIKHAGEEFGYLDFGKYADQLKDDMAAEEEKIAQAIQEIDAGEPYRAPGGPVGGMAPDLSQPLTLIQDTHIGEKTASTTTFKTPDNFYPTDNDLEIPVLSKKYMADRVGDTFVKWGEISRKAKMTGCWHFYVEDPKFESLWKDPTGPLMSGAQACVEVNYTVSDQTPKARIIWLTFMKRYLARYWQANGMKIFVDLNVNEKGVEVNQVGIPDGWMPWFTRGYSSNLHGIKKDYQIATAIAGTDDPVKGFIFGIYGGGKAVQDLAIELSAVWFPERMQEVSSGNIVSGQKLKVDPDKYQDLS